MHSYRGEFSALLCSVPLCSHELPRALKLLANDEAERIGGRVSTEAELERISQEQTCAEKLAQLFPGASPMRIPVRVLSLGSGRQRLQEKTVIEFGTANEVLFSSQLPLEFEDRVQLLNSDGSLDACATVVAVRYHNGRKAVAARFVGSIDNWIIKP